MIAWGTRIGYGNNPPWHTNSYGSITYRWPELTLRTFLDKNTSSWISWGKVAQQVFNARMHQFHSLFAEREKWLTERISWNGEYCVE